MFPVFAEKRRSIYNRLSEWVGWAVVVCAFVWRLQQWLQVGDDNENERKSTHNSHDHRLSQKCATHEKCLHHSLSRLLCFHISCCCCYFVRNFKPATEATTTKLATKLDHQPISRWCLNLTFFGSSCVCEFFKNVPKEPFLATIIAIHECVTIFLFTFSK